MLEKSCLCLRSLYRILLSGFNLIISAILSGHIAEYTLSIRPDDEDWKTLSATTQEN